MAHPEKFPLDAEKFKGVKLEDENLKKMVREWMENDPKMQQSLRDWIKQNPADGKQPDMKKLQGELKAMVDDARKKRAGQPAGLPEAPPGPGPVEPAAPKEDPLAKLAERALKQTERSKLGEWLRDSPAWKQAFDDLRGAINDPDAPGWKLEGWQAKLFDPEGGAWQFGEKAFEHLRDLPRPDFDGIQWNAAAPELHNIPAPNLGAPTSPAIGKTATWILVALLVLLVGSQFLRWRKRPAPATQTRPDLGPWPVRPEAVATSDDLVRAFDYLALWTLGLAVASWNHQAVARRCANRPPPAPNRPSRSPNSMNKPATPPAPSP